VDCDAFYVQVARLEDPEGVGRTRLLIVGGSSSGRGVVTSASYAAREYGVRSAMPTARALRLCPRATVVPVPREACSRRSRAVRSALEELAPVVQAASIDEFYLDLTGTERLFRGETLEDTARRIRQEVLERTEVSVSIGGGTRRLIAKLATTEAKPAGVYIVPPGEEEAFLRTLDLAAIPGVGPALLASLKERGLVRVEDALQLQEEWLRRWFGERRGRWLWRRIRGLDDSEVDPDSRRKSISSERTFSRDLTEDHELERRLLELTGDLAATLRTKGFRARTVTVKLKDHRFRVRQHSRTLPEPVESDQAVTEVARALLHELREEERSATRLLGVGLSGLVDADTPVQLGLFSGEAAPVETERDRALSAARDQLRHRFGEGVVRPGRLLDGPSPGRRSSSPDPAEPEHPPDPPLNEPDP